MRNKALYLVVCMVWALSAPGALWAEAVGSPAGIVKKGKWVMGLSGGGILDRQFRNTGQATVYQVGHYRGYGLTDWLSLYGKIGVAYLQIDDPAIIKPHDSNSNNQFGANVLVSVQTKARFWQRPDWGLEWDGSLRYTDIHARHLGKNEVGWHEWQLATSVAKSLGRFTPYLGASYSILDVKYRVRQNGELLQQGFYHQNEPIGLFVGTDYTLGHSEDTRVNVEASFINGTEVNVAVQYLF